MRYKQLNISETSDIYMNGKTLKLEGWKSRKMGDVGFLQCPYCGYCFEGININKDNTVECYKCKKRFNKDKLKTTTLKKPVAICNVCGAEVSLTPENLDLIGGYSYMCPKCGNHVAIKFKGYTIKPQTVMNLKWNKKIVNKALELDDKLSFAVCKDKKDFLILKIMQLMAKKEDTGFLYVREKKQKAGLVFDVEKGKYVGFIGWTEGEKVILRQIFIIKDERLKGHGTKLLKFWVENIADKINDRFGVETPNEISQKILVNLGYAKIGGDSLQGIKCYFVPSC